MEGFALTPSFTNKSAKKIDGTKTRVRYRYYISQQAIRQGYRGLCIRTLNAELLEEAVKRMLVIALPRIPLHTAELSLSEEQVRHRLHCHASRIAVADSPYELAQLIRALHPRIIVAENAIQIHVTTKGLTKLIELPTNEKPGPASMDTLKVDVGMGKDGVVIVSRLTLKRSRGHTRIFDADSGEIISVARTEPRPALIQALAQAEFWRAKWADSPDSSLAQLLKPYQIKAAYVRRLLKLAYLAPDIKRAIMQGTQPSMLRVQDLLDVRAMDWEDQRRELRFQAKASESH